MAIEDEKLENKKFLERIGKQVKKQAMAWSLLALSSIPMISSAFDGVTSGFLLQMCREPKLESTCSTFLMASVDGMLIADRAHSTPKICTPRMTMGLLTETVKQEMVLNPKLNNEKATSVIYSALLKNFPCK